MFGERITLAEAARVAAIHYPENPVGVGCPTETLAPTSRKGVREAVAAYLDRDGRGVWLDLGNNHMLPCRARAS